MENKCRKLWASDKILAGFIILSLLSGIFSFYQFYGKRYLMRESHTLASPALSDCNIANWYWLGHDLLYIAYRLQRQGENGKWMYSPEKIRLDLTAAVYQLREAELTEPTYENRLHKIIDEVNNIKDNNGWTMVVRYKIAGELNDLGDDIGFKYVNAKNLQSGYKPPPSVFRKPYSKVETPAANTSAAGQTTPGIKIISPSPSHFGDMKMSVSTPKPIQLCKNDSRVFSGLKITVQNVTSEAGKRVVYGTVIEAVDKEAELKKFSAVETGTCMIYRTYSIKVESISGDFECADFTISRYNNICK
jgi:hypothetical protein